MDEFEDQESNTEEPRRLSAKELAKERRRDYYIKSKQRAKTRRDAGKSRPLSDAQIAAQKKRDEFISTMKERAKTQRKALYQAIKAKRNELAKTLKTEKRLIKRLQRNQEAAEKQAQLWAMIQPAAKVATKLRLIKNDTPPDTPPDTET